MRRWFLTRLAEQLTKEKEQMEKANKGNKRTYNVGEGPGIGPRKG
jgi:hypothetical protein